MGGLRDQLSSPRTPRQVAEGSFGASSLSTSVEPSQCPASMYECSTSSTKFVKQSADGCPRNTANRNSLAELEQAVARHVFVDVNTMKDRVRAALIKPQYNVKDQYKDKGFWQW